MIHTKITSAAEAFLENQPNLILATIREDGRPQLSPVWFVWRDGSFFISTMTTTAKWRNLLRDPRCSGIVDDPNGEYIYVTAVAELSVEENPLSITEEIVHKYKTDEEYGPYMESIHGSGERGIIRLTPDGIVTRELD